MVSGVLLDTKLKISQFPQHSWVQTVKPRGFTYVQFVLPTWSSSTKGKFVLPFCVFSSGYRNLHF